MTPKNHESDAPTRQACDSTLPIKGSLSVHFCDKPKGHRGLHACVCGDVWSDLGDKE
jgi:hypothetical protein